jgi:hypothetical protein
VDVFPDGGSDYGVILGPDGTVYQFDAWWGSEKVDLNEKPPEWGMCGQEIHAGRILLNEQGTANLDPLEALIPGIRRITAMFRTGDLLGRDWSPARDSIIGEETDPAKVIVIDAATGGDELGATFVFPNERAFLFTAETDPLSKNTIRIIEWTQLTDSEVDDYYGGFYKAALRILESQEPAV